MTTPVLAICGWSGSGKTTLIEALLPRLRAQGLRVGVIKHDAHGLQLDAPGKDTDRFFNAGAAQVVAYDGTQLFSREPIQEDADGSDLALERMRADLDLILVEGHKDTALPKIWIEAPDLEEGSQKKEDPAAKGDRQTIATLSRDKRLVDRAEEIVLDFLRRRAKGAEQSPFPPQAKSRMNPREAPRARGTTSGSRARGDTRSETKRHKEPHSLSMEPAAQRRAAGRKRRRDNLNECGLPGKAVPERGPVKRKTGS